MNTNVNYFINKNLINSPFATFIKMLNLFSHIFSRFWCVWTVDARVRKFFFIKKNAHTKFDVAIIDSLSVLNQSECCENNMDEEK